MTKLSLEERERRIKEAVRLIDEEGITQAEASKRVQIDQSYVSKYMIYTLGRRTRDRKTSGSGSRRSYTYITPELMDTIKAHASKNWTQARIARKYNISAASVARVLYGDKRRSESSKYNSDKFIPKKEEETVFNTTDTFDRIDIEIMKTQMRLEILKELKGK